MRATTVEITTVVLHLLAAFSLSGCGPSSSQAGGGDLSTRDLAALAETGGLTVVNREVSVLHDEGGSAIELSAAPGDGLAWLDGAEFTTGTITLDVRGRDVPGQSFVGVAFNGVDDQTYEAVYLRPFNFRASNPVQRGHAVQYIAHPESTWNVLRESYPEVYENPVTPPPDPDEWVTLRVEVEVAEVRAYVGDGDQPDLIVDRLAEVSGSRIGLWVGNNSEGAFANMRVRPGPVSVATGDPREPSLIQRALALVGADGSAARTEDGQGRGSVVERIASQREPMRTSNQPDYSAPADAPYTAEEVRVSTLEGHTLVGTLTLPKNARGPLPAVVTITGSSPQDRDHNQPDGGAYRIFRQLADTLGRRGIAVLRMDDRGVGASTGDFESATTPDRANDIRAGITFLRNRPEIDQARIALVGLSEGGLIAPMIAAKDTALAGIVLLAGPGSIGHEVIRYQVRSSVSQDSAIAPGQRDSAARAVYAEGLAEVEGEPWPQFFLSYDPIPTAKMVTQVPVLLMQGTTDRNVPPSDAAKLEVAFRQAGNPDVTLRMLEEVNHIFLRDPDGNPEEYSSLPSFDVAPDILGIVVDWLWARLRL